MSSEPQPGLWWLPSCEIGIEFPHTGEFCSYLIFTVWETAALWGVRSKVRLPHGWGYSQSQSNSQADGSCNIVLKRGRGNVGLGRRKRKWQQTHQNPLRISSSLGFISHTETPCPLAPLFISGVCAFPMWEYLQVLVLSWMAWCLHVLQAR